MLKIKKSVKFSHKENRMKKEGDVVSSKASIHNNKNLFELLKSRFSWMNNFIKEDSKGVEVGAAAGFSKYFIKCKDFKISDLSSENHLDYKNIDAQNTGFKNSEFDFVIASNMIHHLPYPLKFFKEMSRILKKGGKLIIFDAHCSTVLQFVLILMKHEGFDFTKNVWDETKPATDPNDLWSGNSAIPYLLFNNQDEFKKNLGTDFSIRYIKRCECLLFLNSGGVTSKTFYVPLNNLFLNFLTRIDKLLSLLAPGFFSLAYKIVLEKN